MQINSDIHQEVDLGTRTLQESVGIDIMGEIPKDIEIGTSRISVGTGTPPVVSNGTDAWTDDVRADLYRAATEGNWQDAKSIMMQHQYETRDPVTDLGDTILHMAIAAEQTEFAKKLLSQMESDDLGTKNVYECTALHAAAASGMLEIAQIMVDKNKELLEMRSLAGHLPLDDALFTGNRTLAFYLLYETLQRLELWSDERQCTSLFFNAISGDLYDIALKILLNNRKVALKKNKEEKIALELLAKKTSWIGAETHLSACEKSLNSWSNETCSNEICSNEICSKSLIKRSARQLVHELWKEARALPLDKFYKLLRDEHPSLLIDAAKSGNVEFLSILEHHYPDITNLAIKLPDGGEGTIFHIAVSYRQESVFNMIHDDVVRKKTIRDWVLEGNNNLLHLTASLPPKNRLNTVFGEALQMQRELLWFKEIEKIVPPSYVKSKNLAEKTPQDVFMETHENLRNKGVEWMKSTAKSCMLVATLIGTVVFAAIFTVPGGFNQKDGTPIFLEESWFSTFFISNIIALLSSSTSLFTFLSIMTSRYKDDDFLKSLPRKLVFGLSTLFISIAGMILAFSAACFLAYKSKDMRIPIVAIIIAGLPIILFLVLHCNLWFEILCTTYGSKFLFQPSKSRFRKRRKMPNPMTEPEKKKVKEEICLRQLSSSTSSLGKRRHAILEERFNHGEQS